MIKLIEVSQKITFESAQNTRSTTILVPWTAIVAVVVVGPLVVSAFRRPVAPVTNLYSVQSEAEKSEPEVKDV